MDNDPLLFKRLTEPVRRGRRRIKEEFVPELAAWLRSQSYQYERIVEHFRHIQTKPTDGKLVDNGQYARHALSVIQTLINSLAHGIDGNNWRDAVAEIRSFIGVEAGDVMTEVLKSLETNPIDLKPGE